MSFAKREPSRWKLEPERAAGGRTGIHADGPAMRFDGELAERQAEPSRVVRALMPALDGSEFFEDLLPGFRRHAIALVVHLDAHAGIATRDRDAHRAACGRVLDGVAEEVFQRPADDGTIAVHSHGFGSFNVDPTFAVHDGEGRTYFAGHPGQIPDRALDRHLALFEPAHVEQVVDHLAEHFGR